MVSFGFGLRNRIFAELHPDNFAARMSGRIAPELYQLNRSLSDQVVRVIVERVELCLSRRGEVQCFEKAKVFF